MNRILRGEELAEYMHNALTVEQCEDGYIRPRRFTDRQVARYEADSNHGTHGNYGPITRAGSGVTLDFVTDSSFVGLNFTWLDVIGYSYACFDFYVDGVLFDDCYMENPRYSLMAFQVPEGTHHIQIYFPWNSDTKILEMHLSEGAQIFPAPEKSHRILTFGDSITQGYIGIHPSVSYANIMARKLNAELLNQAIGGYYFEKGSLDEALTAWKPDLITVAYGTNDFTHSATEAEFRAACGGFVERLTELFPDTRILGIMPIYRNDERFGARLLMREYTYEDAMNIIRETYAKSENITVLEDHFYPHSKDFFAPDFLHPNDQGFLFYGEAVVKAIRKMTGETE